MNSLKQYSTRVLRTVAGFYLTFPFSYVVAIALLFNVTVANCARVFFSPLHWFISAFAIMTGFGLWEVRRWSWYVLATTNTLLVYQNFSVLADYGETHYKPLIYLIAIMILSGVTYRVAREIRVPYFFPRIRWWESNPRYKIEMPSVLKRQDGSVIEGLILDLSVTGCFVKLRSELLQDERLKLNFSAFDSQISCEGVVVWRANSTVTHPRGVGVKFEGLMRSDKRILRVASRRLKEVSKLYKKSRNVLTPEQFAAEIEKIGKGEFKRK